MTPLHLGLDYDGKVETNPKLKIDVISVKLNRKKVLGFDCGPRFGNGVLYDVKSTANLIAAAGKNLQAQVPEVYWDQNIRTLHLEFIEDLLAGELDAWRGTTNNVPFRPATFAEVVAAAFARSGKKGRNYLQGVADLTGRHALKHLRPFWTTRPMVKFEVLSGKTHQKDAKAPRLINNTPTSDVVRGRTSSLHFDAWMKRNRPTVKGKSTADKLSDLDRLNTLIGHSYVLGIDDTARDANVTTNDFALYRDLLSALGFMTPEMEVMLKREGFVGHANGTFISGKWTSLLSGVDFTSALNMVVSWFGGWYLCKKVLGLKSSDWGILAEGDDQLILMRGRKTPFDQEDIAAVGRRLAKVWKIESQGWPEDQHAFIGGNVTKFRGKWHYVPSPKRMFLKSTIALCPFGTSRKEMISRLKARALALSDRYSHIPIGWAIAEKVSSFANTFSGKARFTREEEFVYTGTILRAPDQTARLVYQACTGITVDQQLRCEDIIHNCAQFDDLRYKLPLDPQSY